MSRFPPDYKEPSYLFPIILLVVLLSCAVLYFFWIKPEKPTVNQSVIHNIQRDTLPILIVFTDTTDEGRPMYSVFLPDSTSIDFMYPEEITNSLNTGKWRYDD